MSRQSCDMAAGRPGLLTTTGLHTFVDPRHGGGKQSPRTTEDLVELVTIGGREYLLYRSLPVDVAVIRGTTADEAGNVTAEEEAYFGENFSIAAATRRNGGTVVCQVKRLAAAGTLPGKEVKVPGALVDYLVVVPEQRQTYDKALDPGYAGLLRQPDTALPRLPFDIRKVIARRGAMELFPGAVVNLGFGVSNGISAVAAEEGFYKELTLTVEQGIIGGVPAGGKDAGAGVNYDMMVDQPYQFDFYDGGGLDLAFLSFAEVDADGNVNVSRYAGAINGPGGFINISQGAKRVVFSGTLTTGGLAVAPDGVGGLRLEREGRTAKWLPRVQQVTFNGRFALERGQEVMYVTDRAVFRLTADGIELIEIAPGIDLARDVEGRIGFPLRVSDRLEEMDGRLFRNQPVGLLPEFRARAPAPRRGRRRERAEEAE
jgi:propionate CoA-transferase